MRWTCRVTATTPRSGMATTDYDAVLLDVTLPGKTGLELAREWRASARRCRS